MKDLEKKVKALHRHLSAHPMATVDLIFWADLAQEDILRGLQTSQARWLSILKPMESIHRSYTCILGHLFYQWTHHCKKEARQTVAWVFQGLAQWETRITLAALVDVLRIAAWHSKLGNE